MIDDLFTGALTLAMLICGTLAVATAFIGKDISAAPTSVKSVPAECALVDGNRHSPPAATAAATGCTDAGTQL
jgi:hypothetical protein